MFKLKTLGTVDLRTPAGDRAGSVLAQRKRLALLAYLAVEASGTLQSRDAVLALFWPDSDSDRARNSLNQAVHYLRRSLGPGVVVTRGQELGLDPEQVWCDAAAFQAGLEEGRLEDALRLYRGDLLEGFHVDGSSGFERWLEGKRRKLREDAVAAARRLASRHGAAGEATEAVRWRWRAATLAPYQESVHRELMEELARAGEPAAAVRAYDAFEARLAGDLELEPSEELASLAEALRNGDDVEATVRLEAAGERDPEEATAESENAAGATPGGSGPAEPGSALRRRAVSLGAGALLLLLGIWAIGRVGIGPAASDPVFDAHRVLVLPFENRTGEPELDWVGSMAAEWITRGLLRTGTVDVVPAVPAARREAGPGEGGEGEESPPGPALADFGGAGLVVSGAYYREGDILSMVTRVTAGETGELLRSLTPIRVSTATPRDAVEEVRRRVVGALATVLDERLASWAEVASQPPSFEAYRLYSKGLDLFFDLEWAEAGPTLAAAAAADSTFSAPLVWAVYAYENGSMHPEADSLVEVLRGRRERLTPWERTHLELHEASRSGRWEAAHKAAHRLVALAPRSEWRYKLAVAALRVNRPREAAEVLEATDPDLGWLREWPTFWDQLADAHHAAGEFSAELAAARRGLERFSENGRLAGKQLRARAILGDLELRPEEFAELAPGTMSQLALELALHGRSASSERAVELAYRAFRSLADAARDDFWTRFFFARLLLVDRRWEAARDSFAVLRTKAAGGSAEKYVRNFLGISAARTGDEATARRMLEQVRADERLRPYEVDVYSAGIYAHLGETARAMAALRRGYPAGWTRWHAQVSSRPLWEDPDFREWMRPKG